jgi:hypothetical protein
VLVKPQQHYKLVFSLPAVKTPEAYFFEKQKENKNKMQ